MSENNYVKSDKFAPVASGQAVVEARQMLEQDCKVLSVSATASVRPSEVFAGEARYAGKVRFDCLVLCDNRVECMSVVAEFSDKIAAPAICAGMNVVLMPETVNTEASLEGKTLKLVAVVDVKLCATSHSECNIMTVPDNGVFAEKKTIDYCTVRAETSEVVYITDSLANVKATEILCTCARATVTAMECADNEVKVSGTVYTDVIVRSDDGLISSCRIVTPYAKSLSALGASADSLALASVAVTESAATLAVEPDCSTVELSVTVLIDATVIGCGKTDAIVDVFCADNEIETSSAEMTVCSVEPQTTVTDTIDGQITLEKDRLAADNVLCVTNTFCQIAGARAEDKRVYADGLAGGDIIYYNAEKNAVDSIAFRLPFSMPLSVHTEACDVSVSAVLIDVSVRVRRESVFDVKAEAAFTVRQSSQKSVSVVESVKLGEPIARPNATVIVHIAKKGETLWQAAKALCCSPDRVTEQNSACAAPYSGGERLINFCNK